MDPASMASKIRKVSGFLPSGQRVKMELRSTSLYSLEFSRPNFFPLKSPVHFSATLRKYFCPNLRDLEKVVLLIIVKRFDRDSLVGDIIKLKSQILVDAGFEIKPKSSLGPNGR